MSDTDDLSPDLCNRTDCPRGFDRWGFGNFVRYRDKRPVEAYAWRGGKISWITTDEEQPMRSGICLVGSFKSHHRLMAGDGA